MKKSDKERLKKIISAWTNLKMQMDNKEYGVNTKRGCEKYSSFSVYIAIACKTCAKRYNVIKSVGSGKALQYTLCLLAVFRNLQL